MINQLDIKEPWWLKFVNFFLQFFFVRIFFKKHKVVDQALFREASIMNDGGMSLGGAIQKYHVETYFIFNWWVRPFTGWKGRERYIGHGGSLQLGEKTIHQPIGMEVKSEPKKKAQKIHSHPFKEREFNIPLGQVIVDREFSPFFSTWTAVPEINPKEPHIIVSEEEFQRVKKLFSKL